MIVGTTSQILRRPLLMEVWLLLVLLIWNRIVPLFSLSRSSTSKGHKNSGELEVATGEMFPLPLKMRLQNPRIWGSSVWPVPARGLFWVQVYSDSLLVFGRTLFFFFFPYESTGRWWTAVAWSSWSFFIKTKITSRLLIRENSEKVWPWQ